MTDVPTNNIKAGQPKVPRPQPLRIATTERTKQALRNIAALAGITVTALVTSYIDEGLLKARRAEARGK